MFALVEPQWGIELLKSLYAWMMQNPTTLYRVPKFADIFVFVYPVFFVGLYFRGKLDVTRDKLYYKISALFIACSALVAVIVNIAIQFFVDKSRPNIVLGLVDEKTETILHKFLPAGSFPSDHAAISMSIAMATLLWGIVKKDRRFVWISIPLFAFSFIMSFCRITAGIHRPTDIIAGSVVGIVVPLVVVHGKVFVFLERIFGWIGKRV